VATCWWGRELLFEEDAEGGAGRRFVSLVLLCHAASLCGMADGLTVWPRASASFLCWRWAFFCVVGMGSAARGVFSCAALRCSSFDLSLRKGGPWGKTCAAFERGVPPAAAPRLFAASAPSFVSRVLAPVGWYVLCPACFAGLVGLCVGPRAPRLFRGGLGPSFVVLVWVQRRGGKAERRGGAVVLCRPRSGAGAAPRVLV